METVRDISQHPCFNIKVKGRRGRVHLPVAPRCNISCNFCNRLYDCVNESRPGVTSVVLSPHQALAYLNMAREAEPRLAVAGIAGPGDPLANPEETLNTLRLIREKHPDMLTCLATNGLGLPAYLEDVAELASHVTVTVNALDPEVGGRIYAWARDGKVIYRKEKAAELLIARQMEGIEGLAKRGSVVKINTIIVPGVNEGQAGIIAQEARARGAHLMNLMPLFPNPGTPLGDIEEPSKEMMTGLRGTVREIIPQMTHCTRCRADAVGLLGQDKSAEMHGCLSACGSLPEPAPRERPFVAVGTREGMLVNLHLGQAESFQIWTQDGNSYRLVDERPAPPAGGGDERWKAMAELFKDCRAVLINSVGQRPSEVLEASGVKVVMMEGFLEEALRELYQGGDLRAFKKRAKKFCTGGMGKGGGEGCC